MDKLAGLRAEVDGLKAEMDKLDTALKDAERLARDRLVLPESWK